MYTLSAYYHKSKIDFMDKKHPLFIGSCGTYHLYTIGKLPTHRPKEEQRYYYYGTGQTEVYWVHFTGNNVKNILRKYGITDNTRIIYTGISIEYKNLFMSMIEELNLQRISYEEMPVNYFMILLIHLHRLTLQKPRKKNLQNMSISWFIQNFRQYANTTPAQYIQS